MRIMITGADGKVGSLLAQTLSDAHDVSPFTINDLDITDFERVVSTVQTIEPDLLINAAAWTDVDGCARNPEKAVAVNGYAPQNLAIATHQIGSAILHISSNEVFDGKLNRPYQEYDPLRPINPYGYSKMVGERAVVQTNPKHYIVRTSWLFAHGGGNFIQAILNAVNAGKSLRVVVDEVANPTYNNDLVLAITRLVETGRYGTYHLVNQNQTSRYGFARYFLDQAGYQDVDITPISRHQWPRPSTPPVYTSLDNIFAKQLGITLRDWREAVSDFLDKERLVVTGKES